jgi:hypothetical protein
MIVVGAIWLAMAALGVAARVALITCIVSQMNCGPLPEEWAAITRFSASSSATSALASDGERDGYLET